MSQEDQIQDDANTASLADLLLTAEEADQTKAGSALIGEAQTGEGKRVVIHFCQT